MIKRIFTLLFLGYFSASAQMNTLTNPGGPRLNAPVLSTKQGWVNVDKPIDLMDLRGKIVLLDFWTYGCINCQHLVPELKRLEQEYSKELVVIGVHSAKFAKEKETEHVLKAIQKYGIQHPVINDGDRELWSAYTVKAWPTVVMIDPEGKIVGQQSGEGIYWIAKPTIDKVIAEFSGRMNLEPFSYKKPGGGSALLRFPQRIISDSKGNYFVSDGGNNRIIKINKTGKILEKIGDGSKGFKGGTFANAQFNDPQGMALKGNILYIADTRNHSIRKIDLNSKQVSNYLGTGIQNENYIVDDAGPEDGLNSPWDLWIDGNTMYIAMAGCHQIWKSELAGGEPKATAIAGDGAEALRDGQWKQCSFNQPSGIYLSGGKLYIADPEASAIRVLDVKSGVVKTILGSGLFTFGDADGPAKNALIQHSMDVAVKDNWVYIADTYNGKIKVLDTKTNIVSTLAEGLDEPNGLLLEGETLWVTDTNNHQIVQIDLKSKTKTVLQVHE